MYIGLLFCVQGYKLLYMHRYRQIQTIYISSFETVYLDHMYLFSICFFACIFIAIFIRINVQQSMHLHSFAPICTYAASTKHENKQIYPVNIYIWSIYMFSRPNICMYGLHICIYSDKYSCTQIKLHIYIYIYIYTCSARPSL